MISTRRPTGEVGWPMLLVEGKEGTRKTSEALRLSVDPRIGHAYVIEVGERRVDEYASLGNFLVVEHDGTLAAIVGAIREVMNVRPLEGRPTLLIIDSGTALWDLVKRHAESIARSSKRAVETLERDPNAEIEVGHQAWNRAKDPWWWGWMNELRAWPGVFVMTARSDEVSKFVDGRPVANATDYRVDVERGTPFIFDATVRMRGARPALVTMAKSLNFSVPTDGLELPLDMPLSALVFDHFEAGTTVELTPVRAKQALMAVARSVWIDEDKAKAACLEAWSACNADVAESFDHLAMQFLVDSLPQPEPDQAVRSLVDLWGAEHAARVATLMEAVNAESSDIGEDIAAQFGPIAQLPPATIADAEALLDELVEARVRSEAPESPQTGSVGDETPEGAGGDETGTEPPLTGNEPSTEGEPGADPAPEAGETDEPPAKPVDLSVCVECGAPSTKIGGRGKNRDNFTGMCPEHEPF